MPHIITTADAFDRWTRYIKPEVIEQYGKDDDPALSESWNNYTDGLCDGGELTGLQYHYAPAYDDSMPGDSWDEELSHLLENMGVVTTCTPVDERPDATDFVAGSRHWYCSITRGGERLFNVYYSQGPAYSHTPDAGDVMGSLFKDMVDSVTEDFEADFKEWATNIGYDTDSRKNERLFRACLEITAHLKTMFKPSELDDLREVANEI